MKFIVSSSVLLKTLQSISGVLNTSNSLPILDNFLFEVNKNKLQITGSDLETTMMSAIELEKSDKGGLVAIPARLLLEILKSLPDQPITFTINSENFGIELNTDYGKYKLSGQNGDVFPKTPKIEGATKLAIPAHVINRAIGKTVFATGSDELRPVMSGVYFQLGKDALTFVATDAHKLVRYKRTDAKALKEASFILPKKPLNLLKNTLAGLEADVQVEYNETNASFNFENTTIICRLIEGKYPNYEAVIPKNNPNVLTVDRNLMLNSLRRVSIFSNKTTHQVRLSMSGSELTLSAEDIDFSNEATERLTCKFTGEDMEIGFNSKFLIEMLSNLECENISIEMSAPNRAGVLFPVEKIEDGEEIMMLVMPVMLNS